MVKQEMRDAELLEAFQLHAKAIERMSWKNQDYEQFTEAQLPLLRSLAAVRLHLPKSKLRKALHPAKLALSPAEGQLLLEKIKGSISYAKRRLRDCGSGRFLPLPVAALLRVWTKPTKTKLGKVSGKKAILEKSAPTNIKGAVDKKAFVEKSAPTNNKGEVGDDKMVKDVETVEKCAVDAEKPTPTNIREIFGLGAKPPAPCVDLSACSSPEAEPIGAASTASAPASASQGGT